MRSILLSLLSLLSLACDGQSYYKPNVLFGASSQQVEFKVPSATFPEFTVTPGGTAAKLWRSGGQYYTDYNFDYVESQVSGNTGYVDLETGSDSNPCTSGSPCLSMAYAVSQNFNIFYVRGKGKLSNSPFTQPAKHLAFYAWGPDRPELTSQIDMTWSQNGTYPDVYQASSATGIGTVFDRNWVDSNGRYRGLLVQTSVANVNATPGSFYYDAAADIVYVRTFDSRNPTNNATIVCCADTTIIISIITPTVTTSNTRYFYMENFNVFGGDQNFRAGNTSGGRRRIAFENCDFNHANGYSGSPGQGSAWTRERCIVTYKFCESWYNRDDGWDLNAVDGGLNFVLEWYCRGGKSINNNNDGAVNASTAHESARIMRVGGYYVETDGKPIQDIGTSKSYIVGCTAGNSIASATGNKYAYATASNIAASEMWLIECRQLGGLGYINYSSSTLHLFDGVIGNLGGASNNNSGTLDNMIYSDVYY